MQPTTHIFEHEAMATEFSMRICHERAGYARQAAMEAFRECDRLEGELSRFVESSSISRLNNARSGRDVPINADAYLCLRQGLRIEEVTGGAFDMGFRSRPPGTPYAPACELSEESVRGRVLREQPLIDLGGIGKGYAIDRMGALLEEWGIEAALITGGGSTLLAIGAPENQPGWSVNVGTGDGYLPSKWAISASGFAVQEEHVKDPLTGEKADRYIRTWALAQSAAVSDALSTAFLVLAEDDIGELVGNFPNTGAILEPETGRYARFGMELLDS